MVQQHWKKMIIAFGLVLFALIIFVTGGHSIFWNTVGLGGLMVYFWLFEVIPIYITALFPFIFGIPLGVISKDQLAASYGNEFVYLFFGGFILAMALEKWNVHLQFSRAIIHVIGKSKPRIILGFLLTTGIISMWISNTATALMILPMALAIIHSLPKAEQDSKFTIFLLLSVAYAASIGGMGTLVGSPTNTAMASILQKDYHIHVSFLSWMKIGIPLSISMLLLAYAFFYFALGKERKEPIHTLNVKKEPWNRNQYKVVSVFLLVVLLWSLKDFILPVIGFNYGDEGAAILGAILLFFIPSDDRKPLLNWKDTEKLPWGILLLFGGGTALATMLKENGVITFLSQVFEQYSYLPYFSLLVVVVIIGVFASEVMSNFALVVAFVPVVAQFAVNSNYSILGLCIPVTLAASSAFMLPVGTPPNALVFGSGYLKSSQMAKYGFVMNIIGIVLIIFFSTFCI